MIAPDSEWPAWIRVALIAPPAFFVGPVVCGWWPGNARAPRLFGLAIAGFTVFCVVMISVIHYV